MHFVFQIAPLPKMNVVCMQYDYTYLNLRYYKIKKSTKCCFFHRLKYNLCQIKMASSITTNYYM